ncbi:MAG: FAD binding domain-containing protein [Chloroflexi bacterium]|nr:FAD binding domain-containing protein [Chloroflexota bacterium]
MNGPEWLGPTSLDEALHLRAEREDEATVVAGGTFVGILMNQGFLMPTTLLSLRDVPGLDFIAANGELRLGAMTTHRAVERSAAAQESWPALARAFSLVASPRVRNQATVGGVLADADYASDPPAMLTALGARAVARSPEGEREIPLEELITGYYETTLRPDELLVEVRVPADVARATYRKFRSRSSEDRPCVSVGAVVRRDGGLRVVVGAVADRPQYFPEICSLAGSGDLDRTLAEEIGRRYAEAIDPISDSRGSAAYRKRIIAVEVRRALEELVEARS